MRHQISAANRPRRASVERSGSPSRRASAAARSGDTDTQRANVDKLIESERNSCRTRTSSGVRSTASADDANNRFQIVTRTRLRVQPRTSTKTTLGGLAGLIIARAHSGARLPGRHVQIGESLAQAATAVLARLRVTAPAFTGAKRLIVTAQPASRAAQINASWAPARLSHSNQGYRSLLVGSPRGTSIRRGRRELAAAARTAWRTVILSIDLRARPSVRCS